MSEMDFMNQSKTTVEKTWPDEWYVLEDGRVNGPLMAKEAFTLSKATAAGNARLISRKGFSQWYPISDLASVYKMTANLGEQTSSEIETLKTQVAKEVNNLEQLKAGQRSQKVVPKQIHTKTTLTKHKATGQEKLRQAVPHTAPQRSLISQKAALLQEYFLLRGRLRLGKLKNPWASGFLALPLTLCLYWYFWFSQISREVNWHTKNENTRSFGTILACIPGLHALMVYRLAKQMRQMEEQNGYKNTSPTLAVLLSLIPPFSLVYLQDAANHHWWLHVRHALCGKT